MCRERGISHKAADSFRHFAHRVLHDKAVRTPDEEREDLACLCHFAQQMTGKPVPPELPLLRIDQLAPAPAHSAGTALRTHIFLVFSSIIISPSFYAYSAYYLFATCTSNIRLQGSV